MTIAIENLIEGYSRFRKHFYSKGNVLYKNLSEQGQNPSVLIIACCDSRVDPTISRCTPGELFVIRNVANLVPPYEEDDHYHGTSAALEFGVCVLNIPDIIILGHSQCGGIQALLERNTAHPYSFVDKWMELAICSEQDKPELCERESLVGSLNNLMTFPWIRDRVKTKKLNLHGWYFNLSHGTIDRFDRESKRFLPLIHISE